MLKTIRDRLRHAGRVMPRILERGLENPIVMISEDHRMPKESGMTVEVMPDGQRKTAKGDRMIVEVMLDRPVRMPGELEVIEETAADRQTGRQADRDTQRFFGEGRRHAG